MEELSAFILHSSMKDLKDSIVGDTVLHEVNSHERKSESHAVPGHGMTFTRFAVFNCREQSMLMIGDTLLGTLTSLRK